MKRDGFVRVAASTPEIKVADVEFNREQICANILEGREHGAKIMVFPELVLTGYTCGDLFIQKPLLTKAKKELKKLVEFTEGSDMLVFVGLPWEYNNKLYNVAAAIQDGELLGLVPKRWIPNYSEFYEMRHFNPGWDEEKDTDTCFWEAVSFAKAILERKIAYIKGEERASSILEQAIAQSHDHILQLDQFVPWKKKIVGSDIWFVVYPSKRGGYNAQAVPKDLEHPELVYPFLEDWWGKEGEVLQEISEIKNARFCHASGFLFVADSLDGALEACNYVIRQQKK